MQQSVSVTRSRAAEFPLRPLLYAAGAAATAAGVYYYIKKRGDGERRAERADTSLTGDPAQVVCAGSALVESDLMSDADVTQTDSAVPEDSLTEAEEKNQKDVGSSAPVDSEKSNLEDRLRELEELLCETHRECEIKTKECEREREAHSILKLKYDQMTETLANKEESLKVSLAEAEERYKLVIRSCAQLESDLMSQVNTLKASLQQRVEELRETHRKCDEITSECEQEREAHSIMKSQYEQMRETVKQCDELLKECERECKAHNILKSKYNQMKETLTHNEESLNNFQVSLAEAERKYEKAMKLNAQLENENSRLISDMDLLQGSMQQQEEELNEAYRKCGMMMMEYEQEREARSIMKSQYEAMKESVKWCEKLLNDFKQEREAHSILKSQYEEMTETITHREESLKNLQVALAEAERKYKQVMESNAQLEKENTHLISDTDILQDCVHELEEKLFKIRRKHDKLAKDRQQAGKAYSILQSQYEETLKQRDELLKECECEREAHNILKTQYNQMKETFTHNEESLKEEKYEPVMESSAQLESDLMSQVNTLQASVQQLEEELLETRRKCDEITSEREKEQEVHSFLKLRYQEMRETLKQCSELLKNHRIALGSEEPVDL